MVRPVAAPSDPRPQSSRQAQKVRSKLEAERAALARWMPRLKRAFNSVLKLHQRIARLEKQLATLPQ
jgi:hypothetical protein